jgi:hypothetical protein
LLHLHIYITKFNHYALLRQFDELTLKQLFYDRLKEEVKNILLTLPEVTTLYEYPKKQSCVTFDCSKAAKSANGICLQIELSQAPPR